MSTFNDELRVGANFEGPVCRADCNEEYCNKKHDELGNLRILDTMVHILPLIQTSERLEVLQ